MICPNSGKTIKVCTCGYCSGVEVAEYHETIRLISMILLDNNEIYLFSFHEGSNN